MRVAVAGRLGVSRGASSFELCRELVELLHGLGDERRQHRFLLRGELGRTGGRGLEALQRG
jgi:hypothetical protein